MRAPIDKAAAETMVMNACEFQPRVAALYDGELDEPAAWSVRAHVEQCPACAAELAALDELSRRITTDLATLGEADAAAIEAMHDAVDRAAQTGEANLTPLSLLRTAGLLGALAASVLIVGGAWLLDAPRGSRPAGVVTAPGAADELVAIPPDWERVATTLRAQPRPGVLGDDSPFAPHYAAAIDWMLDGLLPPPAIPNEAKSWSGPRSF